MITPVDGSRHELHVNAIYLAAKASRADAYTLASLYELLRELGGIKRG
jgi:hypothetical protein